MSFNPKVVNLPFCKASKTLSTLHELNYPKLKRSLHVSIACCEKANAKIKDGPKKSKANELHLDSQMKSCLNEKAPIQKSQTTRSSYIDAKPWQLSPNRYDVSEIPYSRLKGSSGAYWNNTKQFKSLKSDYSERHTGFYIGSSSCHEASTKQYKILAAERPLCKSNKQKKQNFSYGSKFSFTSSPESYRMPLNEEKIEKKYIRDSKAVEKNKKKATTLQFNLTPAPGSYGFSYKAKIRKSSPQIKKLELLKAVPSKYNDNNIKPLKKREKLCTVKPLKFFDYNMKIKYHIKPTVERFVTKRMKWQIPFGSRHSRFESVRIGRFSKPTSNETIAKPMKLNQPIFKTNPNDIRPRYREIPERCYNTLYPVENRKKLYKFLPLPEPKILVERAHILRYSDADPFFGGIVHVEDFFKDEQ